MGTANFSQRSPVAQEVFDGLSTLSSSRRFTLEQLETIYALGYSHIIQGQYAQALPILAFLVQYGPAQRHYLYGLALCLQMQGRFDEAVGIYSLCVLIYPDSYEATQRIAQCQVDAHRYDEARETLQGLLAHAQQSGNAQIERKASGMLALLEHSAAE
jgi:type III secretion system low calcium response chaperone LcrH/SycD